MFVPYSKMKSEIVRILKEEGYIEDFALDTSAAHPRIKITNKIRIVPPPSWSEAR